MYKILYLPSLALALTMSLQASIIGNGPPNQSGGSDMNVVLNADSFVLSGASTISQIAFWTLQVDPTDYGGSTYWGIYTDSAGSPNTVVASGNPVLVGAVTGNTTFGLAEYSYSFSVNVALGPGTYWLGLHNGLLSAQPSTSYYWAWKADTGGSKYQDLPVGGPWVPNSSALAFELTSTLVGVPEPASLCLTGAGILAALAVRRKFGRAI